MPTYLITGPDGRKYNVTGQGTADEALAHIQQTVGGPAPQGNGTPDMSDFSPSTADRPGLADAAQRIANGQGGLSWGDVPKAAVANAPASAGRFAGDILGAVTHPIQTVGNVLNLGAGIVEKAIPGQQGEEKYANALGGYLADRYGGIGQLKRTMANDPVGFLADLSTVLTGGETLAAKIPALAKAADIANVVTRVVDPVNAAVGGVKALGTGAGKVAAAVTGVTTGVGGRAIETAARAGYEGGQTSRDFTASMRGNVPMTDVINEAKNAVGAIKQQRQAAYQAGMTKLGQDRTVLDFNKIDNALAQAKPVKVFTGPSTGIKVGLQPSAQKTAADIGSVLKQWRGLPPQDFHTAEGFDALKQRLGDIRDNAERGSPSEALATQVYNVVKGQIVQQAPEYAKTMEGYSKASDLIHEMEGTLSLNRSARIDTQLRKLQSVLRDNANTSYGRRVELAKLLEQNGAKNLTAKLAGQALSPLEPRGLARGAAAGITGLATTGSVATLNPLAALGGLATLAAQSPRVVGESAHALGQLGRHVSAIPAKATLRTLYESRAADPERSRP